MIKNRYRENLQNMLDGFHCEIYDDRLNTAISWNYNTKDEYTITLPNDKIIIEKYNNTIDFDYMFFLGECVLLFRKEIENNINSLLLPDKAEYIESIVEELNSRIQNIAGILEGFKQNEKENIKVRYVRDKNIIIPIQFSKLSSLLKYLKSIYAKYLRINSKIENSILEKRESDTTFIQSGIIETFKTEIDIHTKEVNGYFLIEKNGETRKYNPVEYLAIMLECFYESADKSNNFKGKMSCFINAENKIKRYIRKFDLNKLGYDFSKILEDLDDQIKYIKENKELGFIGDESEKVIQIQKPEIQNISEIQNNFDSIKIEDVYTHFKKGLVEKRYLTENDLFSYLKAAFEQMAVPETLLKIKDAPAKNKIMKVFHDYYKNIAGKPHGKQKKYAALLGDYFEGYSTKNVSSNFNK